MNKKSIKENNFEGGVAGTGGSINTQPGYGTFSSPDISQNSSQFGVGQHSNTAKDVPNSGSMANDLNAIYSKKDVPSPDEVVTGIKYELHNMIKKDKAKAKEIVLQNLRKDPHFYGDLKMLNIDDKSMIDNMNEVKQHPNDRPLKEKINPNIEETTKIFNEMAKAKDKKYVVNSHLVDVMNEMWAQKKKRSDWKKNGG